MNDLKPYLIRAIYQWCTDNDLTPHVVVFVNEYTQVPMQFVQDNEIILNISMSACNNINIDNEWISFSARFSGAIFDVLIPIGHVISIFARENGEGMGFEVKKYQKPAKPAVEKPAPIKKTPTKKTSTPKKTTTNKKTSNLKVVKKKAD